MNQIKPSKEIFDLLDDKEIKTFEELQIILKKLNSISNLTRLIEGSNYWISQVYDSIWPFLEDRNKRFDNKKYIDIGSGCGFPGLAYAITHPNSEIHLIDSSVKKIKALNQIKSQLKLKNKITILNKRIELFAHEQSFRNKFDICTTRAVASPEVVSEYMIPLLNPNGIGIIFCGKWNLEKEQRLNKSLLLLKGTLQNIIKLNLPQNKGERNIVFIKANGTCPSKYPRGVGKPTKYPLGN